MWMFAFHYLDSEVLFRFAPKPLLQPLAVCNAALALSPTASELFNKFHISLGVVVLVVYASTIIVLHVEGLRFAFHAKCFGVTVKEALQSPLAQIKQLAFSLQLQLPTF